MFVGYILLSKLTTKNASSDVFLLFNDNTEDDANVKCSMAFYT